MKFKELAITEIFREMVMLISPVFSCFGWLRSMEFSLGKSFGWFNGYAPIILPRKMVSKI